MVSVLMCFDESINPFIHGSAAQMPMHSDSSDLGHHHHFSMTDHFFQKYSISDSDSEPFAEILLFPKDQTISDHYLSSIWQPPKRSC